jgi:WD40 repeat protein
MKTGHAATGVDLAVLRGHTAAVNAAVFDRGGGLVTGSADGTLRFWDLAAADGARHIWRHGETVYGFAFSPDGTRAASNAWGGAIKLWDVASGRELQSWAAHKISGVGLAWSPDGTTLVSGGNDGAVRAWDAASGKLVREFEDVEDGRANTIAFSPDGTQVLAPSSSGTAKVWELTTGRLVRTLAGHKGEVYDVAWSADGAHLATAGVDGLAKIWDSRSGAEMAVLKGHSGSVYGIAFHPDSKLVATASADRTVRLWNVADGCELAALRGHDELVYRVHFHRAGDRLVSASTDKTVKLWDTATGAQVLSLPFDESVWSAEFSPDGARLVALPMNGNIHALDSASMAQRVAGRSSGPALARPRPVSNPASRPGRVKASLRDFAWLEGRWAGKLGNAAYVLEQEWWPAKAGVMTGMFRLTEGEKVLVLEFFTLRETPEGVELRLRHFDSALVPMEKGDAIILQLVGLDEKEARFENPVHSRPKTSRITRTGADSYVGRSEVIADDGKVSVIEAIWQRVSR